MAKLFGLFDYSDAENINKRVLDVVNNVVMQDIQECGLSTGIDQILDVQGENIEIGDVEMNAMNDIYQRCYQSSDKKTTLINKILDEIQQAAEAVAPGGLLQGVQLASVATSSNMNDIKTTLENRLNMSTFQNCGASVFIKQGAIVRGKNIKIGNIKMTGTIKVNKECENFSKMMLDITNDITTKIAQSAKAGGFDSTLIMVILAIVVVLAIVGAIGAVIASKRKGKKKFGRAEGGNELSVLDIGCCG